MFNVFYKKICIKIFNCNHYFSPLNTLMGKGKDPEQDAIPAAQKHADPEHWPEIYVLWVNIQCKGYQRVHCRQKAISYKIVNAEINEPSTETLLSNSQLVPANKEDGITCNSAQNTWCRYPNSAQLRLLNLSKRTSLFLQHMIHQKN